MLEKTTGDKAIDGLDLMKNLDIYYAENLEPPATLVPENA